MTNREHLATLNAEDRKECEATYSRERHPLYDYIDWDAYWDNEDGNEMHFLRKLDEYTDEFDKKYAVLKQELDEEQQMIYADLFSYFDGELIHCPVNEDGGYDIYPELSQADLDRCLCNN